VRFLRFGLLAIFVASLLVSHIDAAAESLRTTMTRNGYDEIILRRSGGNRLYLTGKLNEHRRSFLVDTGWSYTTTQTNTACDIARDGDAAIGKFSLGHCSFTNQPVRIEDIRFNGQRAPFDLVLGLDFLQRHFAVLDCAGQRLYLRSNPPGTEQQENLVRTLRRSGFQIAELQLKKPLAITVVARLNGQPLEMLVDTAAPWSCVDLRQCERLELKPQPSMARFSGTRKTGIRSVAIAEVESFQLGDHRNTRQTFAVFDLADWDFASPEKILSEVGGILGAEVLAARGALIDCHALKLWLKGAPAK
jgi:hypothetical protein